MAGAYSLDLRKRVVEAIDEGLSTRKAARRFSIGISTSGAWYRDWCSSGRLEPGAGTSRPPVHVFAIFRPTRPTSIIEMAFAKLKAFLRKVAARSVAELWDAVPLAIDRSKPKECENFFAHAGYDA